MATVVQVGNASHDWCTEVHLTRDMEANGHVVVFFQEPRGGFDAESLKRLRQTIIDAEPDLVMWTRTWGGSPEMTQLWRECESWGIKTASYHLDLYVGLEREANIDSDPFWTTQYVFTPDGDPQSAEFFKSKGINHHWMPPAMVSDEVGFGTYRERYDYDVVFVGSLGYHPEWPWRPTLINALAQRYGDRFRRFGGDLPEGPTRGRDLNDLYASAKVVVGDSLCLPGHVNYWSDRVCETLGRGGVLVHPRVPGLAEFMGLLDGREVCFYEPGDLGGVFETVDGLLDQPNLRGQIKRFGMELIRARHTYRHRLEMAFQIMDLIPRLNAFGRGDAFVPDSLTAWDDLAPADRTGDLRVQVHPEEQFFETARQRGSELGLSPGLVDHIVDRRGVHGESRLRVAENAPARLPAWYLGDNPSDLPVSIDRLELGSGYHPTPGFIHLDLNPNAPEVDIVGSAFPLDLPDNCVTGEIRAVDVLEHLSYRDTDAVLAEWFRVMAPGCKLYVQVPNADRIMREYAWHVDEDTNTWLTSRIPANLPQTALEGATWRLLGGHRDDTYAMEGDDWKFNAHYALFSGGSLVEALKTAGFLIDKLEHNAHPNLIAFARKP